MLDRRNKLVLCALLGGMLPATARPRLDAATERTSESPAAAVQKIFDVAQKAEREGDLIHAESEYREALGQSLEQLGLIYSTLGDLDKAELAYQSATQATVDSEPALLGLGVIYLRKGEYEKGVEAVRTVLAQNPFDAQARELLGKLYFAMNRFDASASELQEAARLDPENPSVSFTLAVIYLNQKQPEKARKVFDQMRSQLGDSARLHVLFGGAYRQAGLVSEAAEEFHKAVTLDSNYPNVHYYLALAYLSQEGKQQMPEAARELLAELRNHPDEYLPNYLLGVVYVEQHKLAEAIPYLEKAAHLDPKKPDAPLFLGRALYLSGQIDKAIPVLRRAIELTQDPSRNDYQVSNAHYLLGQGLMRRGETEEAKQHLALAEQYKAKSNLQEQERLKAYLRTGAAGSEEESATNETTKAIVVTPPPPSAKDQEKLRKAAQFYAQVAGNASNQLGLMRASQSDVKRAAVYFNQAADWNPQIPDLDFNLGLAQFKAQNYSAAIAPLEKVRAQQPKRTQVQALLGMSYFFSENYRRAIEQLLPLEKSGMQDPQVLYALGLSLSYSKEQQQGEQVLRSLVQRYPQVADAHLALGQSLALNGDYERAGAEFSRALELDPSLPQAHYYAGLALLERANFREAVREFQEEIARNPQDAKPQYHLGLCLISMNQIGDAIHFLNEAVRLNPGYADAYYELGKVQLRQGKTQEAVSLLEKAVKLEGNKAYIHYQLSQAYLKAGKRGAAEAALARYRQLKARERSTSRDQPITSKD